MVKNTSNDTSTDRLVNAAINATKSIKKTCTLTFQRDKEVIHTWEKTTQGNLLCLTSKLLEESRDAMIPWVSEREGFPDGNDVKAALKRFYQQMAGYQDVLDDVPFSKDKNHLLLDLYINDEDLDLLTSLTTEKIFSLEIFMLKYFVERLLAPRQEVIENISQLEILDFLRRPITDETSFIGVFMAYRLRQLSFCPTSVEKRGEDGKAGRKARRKNKKKSDKNPDEYKAEPRRLKDRFNITYESTGLMALCWAEVWRCIDHEIKANVCPYCWKVYLYPKNNLRKAHCGSKECRNKYIQESNKAKYGYDWEAARKTRRMPGEKEQGRPCFKK